MIENAITKSEARLILDKIRIDNNGIDSVSEITKRLDYYYLGQDLRKTPAFKENLDMARKYFRYQEILKEGGIQADMSRRAGINSLTGKKWCNGVRPRLVRSVSVIPNETPKEGYKWLPTAIDNKGLRYGFIQVPVRIKSWVDIQEVIKRISPLDSPKMEEWQGQFGKLDQETAFAYSLGVILADGSLTLSDRGTTQVTLPLSKKYRWSHDMGEAFSYNIGVTGIYAKRRSDWKAPGNIIQEGNKSRKITGPGFYVWNTENTPILTWVRRSCFGMKDSHTKIENPVSTDWILTAPKTHRIAFLQGVADGDGYVSVNSQYVGLSTKCNQRFYQKLLKTFQIKSRTTPKDVTVNKSDEILKIATLPLFKHAKSRDEDLRELAEMIHVRKSKPVGSRLSHSEIDFAEKLRKRGLSYGGITRRIFKKFGTSWDPSSIEHAIKRRMKKKENNGVEEEPHSK